MYRKGASVNKNLKCRMLINTFVCSWTFNELQAVCAILKAKESRFIDHNQSYKPTYITSKESRLLGFVSRKDIQRAVVTNPPLSL